MTNGRTIAATTSRAVRLSATRTIAAVEAKVRAVQTSLQALEGECSTPDKYATVHDGTRLARCSTYRYHCGGEDGVYLSHREIRRTLQNQKESHLRTSAIQHEKALQPGETGEQYILALYAQAAKCGYTDQARKEQDILDRLVVGIRDTQLSRRMQLDSALTFDKAKPKHVLQTEAVQETHKKLVTPSAGNSRDNPVVVSLQGDDHSDQLISDNANAHARHLGIQTATATAEVVAEQMHEVRERSTQQERLSG